MHPESTNLLRKTMKISILSCTVLGGAALIASGAAVKALTEGAKFLKNRIQAIMTEEPDETAAAPEAQIMEITA